MSLQITNEFRQRWVETQSKYDHPVNAMGFEISLKDITTIQAWFDHGIDVNNKCENQ